MFTINLLSNDAKQKIRLKRVYQILKKINHIFIIFVVLISISLLISKVILQRYFEKIVTETSLVTRNSQGYNDKVREINLNLIEISKIQNNYIVWTDIIKDLFNRTPEGIHFFSVKISNDSKIVKIQGNSLYRDNLLALKENINKSAIFFGADFPLKDILAKENIYFEITANLNLPKAEK